jgi:hypothetical protein
MTPEGEMILTALEQAVRRGHINTDEVIEHLTNVPSGYCNGGQDRHVIHDPKEREKIYEHVVKVLKNSTVGNSLAEAGFYRQIMFDLEHTLIARVGPTIAVYCSLDFTPTE